MDNRTRDRKLGQRERTVIRVKDTSSDKLKEVKNKTSFEILQVFFVIRLTGFFDLN